MLNTNRNNFQDDNRIRRRTFLHKSMAASTCVILGCSFEEHNLLAREIEQSPPNPSLGSSNNMKMGRIGKLSVSRLIVGGNLTSGIAHSRDLIYVSPLLKNYFTDEKIFETWELSEECGINSAILRLDDQVIRLTHKYWNERGGRLQWIAQIKPRTMDVEPFRADIKRAIDNGAVGAYIQGNVSDCLVKDNRLDLLENALQCIKDQGVIAGIGGHSLEVPIACEKAGLEPDFYLKTLHSRNYWTFNPANDPWEKFHVSTGKTYDNVWCTEPEETIAFMEKVNRPWIAFKVMAAGAIHPKEAFQYAYANGADFICAGMFDFQVREDSIIASELLSSQMARSRPWRG
ncbi:MAG: hypothetical protein AB1656_10055 [Candidatus Omnitrophota bacterium]